MTNPASEQKKYGQRTELQNRALHLYFQLVADALNDAGLDMRAVLKPNIDIPWTGETVKEYMWRPIMKIQLRKDSTTELTTVDIDKVFDTLNRHLGEKLGIHEPFPSVEEIIFRQTYGKANHKSNQKRKRSNVHRGKN